jgi:sugar O-acyltransferase (sialic acid O-acetyltransferase NeuD family)
MTGPYRPSNPEFHRLYVFGAGGHGREIAWLAQQSWGDDVEVQFVVDRHEYLRESVNGIPVRLLNDVEILAAARFVVALGDPIARHAASIACNNHGLMPATLVHPRAEVSQWVKLDEGVVIFAGSILTTNVILGAHVHVNISCTISHDVRIGNFSTLSPGVHIAGNVVIGQEVFIGTGANIINGSSDEPLTIGDHSIVAAGACVTKSVATGALVAGIPAIRKR